MKHRTIQILIIFSLSCNKFEDKSLIHIEIEAKNLHVDSMFLAQANFWNQPLIWSKSNNGKFYFNIKKKFIKDNNSTHVSIGYNKNGKIKLIELVNRVLDTTEKVQHVYSSFLLDSDTIKISGNTNISEYFEIKAGLETKAMYRVQMIQFAYFDANPKKRTDQLLEYLKIIAEYPNSTYLLYQIWENKSIANKKELEAMLNRFNPEALESEIGKQLVHYTNKMNEKQLTTNMSLTDANDKLNHIYDSSAKLNMLVVWASWCAPCRQEIPSLKKLYTTYKEKGLSIKSVSIDIDKSSWLKALQLENMPWVQLRVFGDKIQLFNDQLDVGSIPYIVFIDNQGKILYRTIGVTNDSFKEYQKIIEKYLK